MLNNGRDYYLWRWENSAVGVNFSDLQTSTAHLYVLLLHIHILCCPIRPPCDFVMLLTRPLHPSHTFMVPGRVPLSPPIVCTDRDVDKPLYSPLCSIPITIALAQPRKPDVGFNLAAASLVSPNVVLSLLSAVDGI